MAGGLNQFLQQAAGGGGADNSNLTNNQIRDRLKAVRDSAEKRFGAQALMSSNLNRLMQNQADWSDAEAKQGRDYLSAIEGLNKLHQANKGSIGKKEANFAAAGSNIIVNGPKYGPMMNDMLSSGGVLRDLAKLYILLLAPMITGLDKFLNLPGLKQLRDAIGIPTLGVTQMSEHVRAIEDAVRTFEADPANGKRGLRTVNRGNGVIGIVDRKGNPADPESVAAINELARNNAVRNGYEVTTSELPFDFPTQISAKPGAVNPADALQMRAGPGAPLPNPSAPPAMPPAAPGGAGLAAGVAATPAGAPAFNPAAPLPGVAGGMPPAPPVVSPPMPPAAPAARRVGAQPARPAAPPVPGSNPAVAAAVAAPSVSPGLAPVRPMPAASPAVAAAPGVGSTIPHSVSTGSFGDPADMMRGTSPASGRDHAGSDASDDAIGSPDTAAGTPMRAAMDSSRDRTLRHGSSGSNPTGPGPSIGGGLG